MKEVHTMRIILDIIVIVLDLIVIALLLKKR